MALSVAVELLFQRGVTKAPFCNSEEETDNVKNSLENIQGRLVDAERKAERDQKVKCWLENLEDVIYEIEDVLDKWELMMSEKEDDDRSESDYPWEKAIPVISIFCSCLRHVASVGRRSITVDVFDLHQRLKQLSEEQQQLLVLDSYPRIHEDLPNLEIYGREDEIQSVVSMLVSSKSGNIDPQVISIVGMGGVGKTTLAQCVYNDQKVEAFFPVKVWIYVGNSFSTIAVAGEILEHTCYESLPETNYNTIESLTKKAKEVLHGRKLLIVLDDVWTEDPTEWKTLQQFLRDAAIAPGSKILVTTRKLIVAPMMGRAHMFMLGLLSDDECWKILCGVALNRSNVEERPQKEAIGKKIAKSCSGLPLAARAIGSLLAMKTTTREWIAVLENIEAEKDTEVRDVFNVLKLSYDELNPILKGCFLSCIVCPRASEIHLNDMIRIWMAHGLIPTSSTEAQEEGRRYFDQLVERHFFQDVMEDQGAITFQIHDIMWDLAFHLSSDQRQIVLEDGETWDIDRFTSSSHPTENIRTLCARRVISEGKDLFSDVIARFTRVRMLILSDCNLKEVPESIGELVHLRYLDLSCNPIIEIPETISRLYFLQTLNLQNCTNLFSLPQGIKKLSNLKHLLVSSRSITGLSSLDRSVEIIEGSQ